MISLNGYFKGNSWNDNAKKFEVKTIGTPESGAILCGLNISGKDKEGNKVYGKPLDVKINVKSKAEAIRVKGLIVASESMFKCDGFFVPNNWTNKEGKEIKGNQFLVADSTTFVATTPQSSQVSKPAEIEIADETMPF